MTSGALTGTRMATGRSWRSAARTISSHSPSVRGPCSASRKTWSTPLRPSISTSRGAWNLSGVVNTGRPARSFSLIRLPRIVASLWPTPLARSLTLSRQHPRLSSRHPRAMRNATADSCASSRGRAASAPGGFAPGDGAFRVALARLRGLAAVALAAVVLGPPPPGWAAGESPALVLVDETELSPLLDDDAPASLRDAVRQSLAWLERRSPDLRLAFGPRVVTAREQVQALGRVLQLLEDDPAPEVLEARLLAEFDVLRSAGRDDGSVLVTGYHQPIVLASPIPRPGYAVPIFAVPADLPPHGSGTAGYWTRAEIEAGRLGVSARVLAWARDPVDVFFMEVEGSGTLRFPDGREVRIGHAATNGRPYRSIGRLLIDEGKIPQEAMSMQALREWLAAHPGDRGRVLRYN